MPYTERAGTRLFYTAYGSGPPLVLLHGWCGDGNDWCYQWPAFAHDYQVLVPDLRGHGASSVAADGDYSPRAAAQDVLAVMDARGVAEPVVFGHSLGFVVALELTRLAPGRVRALVDVDGSCAVPEAAGNLWEQMSTALQGNPHATVAELFASSFYATGIPSSMRAWRERRLYATAPEAVVGAFSALARGSDCLLYREHSGPLLESLAVPVLAIRAQADSAAWERDRLQHPASRVIDWEGSSHFLHQERPEEFNALVAGWLRDIG